MLCRVNFAVSIGIDNALAGLAVPQPLRGNILPEQCIGRYHVEKISRLCQIHSKERQWRQRGCRKVLP
jgi:hypothetical protein